MSEEKPALKKEDGDKDPGTGIAAPDNLLEQLELVWAKCRGNPWYPALVINHKKARICGFLNGVPVPPVEVLNLAETHTRPHYLIIFFDNKRTWQWVTRDKIERLGVDTKLDMIKLDESKKPWERKAVMNAFKVAIMSGKNADLTEACWPAGGTDQKEGVEWADKGEQKSEEATVNEESDKNIERKEAFVKGNRCPSDLTWPYTKQFYKVKHHQGSKKRSKPRPASKKEKSPFVLGFAVLGFPISELESSEQDQLSPASANSDTDSSFSVKAATTSSDTVNCASTSLSLGKYGDLKSSQGLASLVEAHSDANPAVMNQCEPAQLKVIYICIECNI